MPIPKTPLYEASKIGPTTIVPFTATAAVALALVPDAEVAGNKSAPKLFALYATKDCYLRQGRNGVIAAATDFFLPKGVYIPILAEDASDNWISVFGSAVGDLRVTLISDVE